MSSIMKKIIIIQPKFAHYRYKLFDILNEEFDTTFIFLENLNTEYSYKSNKSPNPAWNVLYINQDKKIWWTKLIKIILKNKPDAIVTSINGSIQSIVSTLLKISLKIPFVLFTESWGAPYRNINKPKWKIFLRKIVNEFVTFRANSIICGGTRSKLFHEKIGVSKEKIFVAYQTTEDIKKLPLTESIRENINKKITILYLSRIVLSKGLDVLIKSFDFISKKNQNVELLIVGDGDFKLECQKLAEELKISNITFVGEIQNEMARKYFEYADIFVLPCSGIGRGEGWGLVLNEAASMSLPIITTNAVGAVGDMVVDGVNGFVVNPGDVDDLTRTLNELIINEPLRKNMGEKSREIFENISDYNKMANGFKSAIEYAIYSK